MANLKGKNKMKAIVKKPLKNGIKIITGDVIQNGLGFITLKVMDKKGSSSIKRFSKEKYTVETY